ncbi:MAG: stage II sporulation protein M [Oscillospiraceae bacterium]|nr:stage II sporulation protein M [Oscillospiraceae bacterium]
MKEQFTKLRQFYRGELSYHLFIATVAFCVIIVLTFILGLLRPSIAANVMEFFANMVREAGLVDDDGSISTVGIFLNNIRAFLVTACYGFLPFLFLPALSLALNGAILGLFAAFYVNNGQSLLVYLAGILPHGVFELPALVLAMSCGLYLCRVITDYVRFNRKGTVKPALANIARVMVLNVLPLTAIAAVIEANVTPLILAHFMG